MMRQGDRVRTLIGSVLNVTGLERNPDRVRVHVGGNVEVALLAEQLTLLCATCDRDAERFAANDERALCSEHAEGLEVRDVRTEGSLCPCACGEDLAAGTSKGIWTLEGIACEYRDCIHCGSTRAFMPADKVPGRLVALYRDPASSEVTEEWHSLLDALESHPFEGAELIRNGVVLARVVAGPKGARAWSVSKPVREVPVRV